MKKLFYGKHYHRIDRTMLGHALFSMKSWINKKNM